MNKICFVNGSPRGKNSGSKDLIGVISGMLDPQNSELDEICIAESLKSDHLHDDFRKLVEMDTIIFVFPLYIDAVPSSMLDFLYRFDEYASKIHCAEPGRKCPRVYAVINNGFVEGTQNVNAARIMRHFTGRIGFTWRFGIGIGAGEFLKSTQQSLPLKSRVKLKIYNALLTLAEDINHNEISLQEDIFVSPAMPKFMFMLTANAHWTNAAKKSRKKLSIKPY